MKNLLFIITLFIITALNAQCVSGNCNNGYGIKKYKDGTMYVGEWWNDTDCVDMIENWDAIQARKEQLDSFRRR